VKRESVSRGRRDRRRGHRQVPRPEPCRIAPAHSRRLDPARRRRRPRDHRSRSGRTVHPRPRQRLETVATSTDGASANRDRAFDFNVFASELFSSLVVHKTAEASLDEGSLGAVVDLNTGNPLGGNPG
jgi:hypothetical protein